MNRLFTILILLTFFLSCEKKNLCDPNYPTLFGSWIWVKSVGGIGGDTITPEILEDMAQLLFMVVMEMNETENLNFRN